MNSTLPNFQSQILTAKEAAPILHVHPAVLRRMAHAGKIPHQRIGSKYLFHADVLDAWVRGGYQTAPPGAAAGDEHGPSSFEEETARRIAKIAGGKS